jgi:hypothetical protein
MHLAVVVAPCDAPALERQQDAAEQLNPVEHHRPAGVQPFRVDRGGQQRTGTGLGEFVRSSAHVHADADHHGVTAGLGEDASQLAVPG